MQNLASGQSARCNVVHSERLNSVCGMDARDLTPMVRRWLEAGSEPNLSPSVKEIGQTPLRVIASANSADVDRSWRGNGSGEKVQHFCCPNVDNAGGSVLA